MGAALSKVIKSIDGASDAEKETRDSLNALYALGESRNDAAFAKATSDALKIYAPIQKVILQRQTIVASASTGTEGIVNGIKNAVGSLMQGQILDGITTIVQNALNIVLGASAGQISSQHTYALIATDLGALLRLDVDVYSFEVTSRGLQQHAKNMTAVSSLVSSINPMSLTLSDLRAIVSMSYGTSAIQRQNDIFKLVREAWEMDRKTAVGQAPTAEDHARFQSLFTPSQYEAEIEAVRRSGSALDSLTLADRRVDRDVLVSTYKKHTTSKAARKRTNGTPNGASGSGEAEADDTTPIPKPSAPAADEKMTSITLWVQLISVADEVWLRHFQGALSGFNTEHMFKFDSVSAGVSGSAVSFTCSINADPLLFDLGVKYCYDTVIPMIRRAEYISTIVARMALQYDHPSKGSQGQGMPTTVSFLDNDITNTSDRIISFISDENDKVILVLQPGTRGTLNGDVIGIQTTKPLPTPPGNANGQPIAGIPAPPPAPVRQWMTYDAVNEANITHGVKMTLNKIPTGGYSLDFYYNHDQPYSVKYVTEWQTGEP